MCSTHCIEFAKQNLKPEEIQGKRVLEIGSYYVNGSLRPLIKQSRPSEYIGVDIVKGWGVDVVCSADHLRDKFGDERFDLIVSTEMMEHVQNWRGIVSNIKNMIRPNGIVMITTRSIGFGYHGYPYDFWRYQISDMENIFSDFVIERLESDPGEPGIFMKARKPVDFIEKDLSQVALYSVLTDTRIKDVDENLIRAFRKENAHKYNKPQKESLKRKTKRFFRDISWRINNRL